jgi:hypothetical protein
MTAAQLIADIFSRPQEKMPPNMRRITEDQVKYLRGLMASEDPARVQYGNKGVVIFIDRDSDKWMVSEDLILGKKHMLTKLANPERTGQPSLF